ncbi:type IV pilus modification PilV family protein [Psychromonas hadalis]|uniref:type IV pilus modification PilV family protein n=1 Tax=Psychromonas hadalis TaxID=211669 RepID=UPI0003B6F8C1|nr:prepilin-type N-terminal cleavage/methylation domain-containing protein [Psychromonas hadalis]
MKMKQQGFTLFEVLISMFIAGVAVLGLAMLELKILRSSQSSFNYTIATIEANTLVDRVWRNLCVIHGTSNADPTIYGPIYSDWKAGLITGLSGETSTGSTTDVILDDRVRVHWTDKNFPTNSANDQVVLNVQYPDFEGSCL